MAVFDGVHYSLSTSLLPARRNELAAVLDLNGAAPHPPYTHIIAPPTSHALNNATNDAALKLVTDRWVDRSVVMGKRQPEQYYSPDPAMIFSGVVACATDLPAADLEVLSAGITALGGQWRSGLTRDVTHLFALRTGSDKYNTALHFAPQTHMCILTPHWFDDAVRLGRRIPEAPYTWPDPKVLRPGVILDIDDDMLATEARRRRKKTAGETDGEAGEGANATNESEHVRVWADRRILLSASLELGGSPRGAIEARIVRAGGVVVPLAEDADEDAEEKAVDECDVLITRWRSGKSYFEAARASLLIGTLSWLFSVESSGTLHSPLDSLLWYPTPRGGIPDLIDCEISVTNYTGAARDYLKRLITLIGAKFTPSMSQSNKVLVAGFQPSPKTTRALAWSIPIVNHTWLEDCLVEWCALTVGLERYIVYPPGIDFAKMLMTRQDGPPSSQAVSAPQLSGGAVPGGRGVGTVNVDQDETHDAEYRARAHGPASTTRGAGDMMDVSMRLDSEAHSRAGSVKKTPTSVRKRGPISTSMTASATGTFVDQVIALPADEDDARMPGHGKRVRSSLAGVHATPRNSRPSAKEVEAVARDVGESNQEKQDKGKGKEGASSGKETSKRLALEIEDDDQPRQKPKPRVVQRKDVRAETDDEAERAPAMGKPRRRAKGMAISSDGSDGESDGSVPPRRVFGAGSATPVKSGMKGRPSKSQSRPSSVVGGDSGDEVRVVTKNGKPREGAVTKEKVRPKATEGKKSRSRSRTRSPSPVPPVKTGRAPKRRLSVLVPSVPKDYFSSQSVRGASEAEDDNDRERERPSGKKGRDGGASEARRKLLVPAESVQAIAAETSTSVHKRGRPTKNVSTAVVRDKVPPQSNVTTKPKPKAGASKPATTTRRDDEDDTNQEEQDEPSMFVEVPSTSRARRSAANKATARLSEIMPDVISFEKEQKMAKRRRSEGGEPVVSAREEEEWVERGGKRRRVRTEEEVEEEADVEDVVSVPSVKAKPKASHGKGKRGATTDEDEDMDEVPAKGKSSAQKEARGRKEGTAIRLMTTGVVLSDDVVKRLTKLGVQMTTKPSDCTHLVAKGIVRTEKFLCAMVVLPWILTDTWANASAKGGKLLPEKNYLLTDAAAEQRWGFTFVDAMARARGPEGGPNLFQHMTFYVTPKVSVDPKLLKNVVSAGGGQVQTGTPTARILRAKAHRYVVSCPEDRAIWRPLAAEGFRVYSAELILRGAMRQEVEWERVECMVAG